MDYYVQDYYSTNYVKCMHNIEVKKMKSEIEQILEQAEQIAKNLKVKRQEALLLIIAHDIASIHFHIDCLVMGMAQAHISAQKKE